MTFSMRVGWKLQRSCPLSSEVLPLTGAALRCQGGRVEWSGVGWVYLVGLCRQACALAAFAAARADEVVQWWLDHVFKILGQNLTWCLQTLHVLCIHTLQPCLNPWTSVCLPMPETTFLELCSGARGFSIAFQLVQSVLNLHCTFHTFHLYIGAAYWEVGKDHTPLQVDYIQQHILKVQMRYTQD